MAGGGADTWTPVPPPVTGPGTHAATRRLEPAGGWGTKGSIRACGGWMVEGYLLWVSHMMSRLLTVSPWTLLGAEALIVTWIW